MEVDICPLAADWGTWGEWFGGVASVVLGIAVLYLTRKTNGLAEASNRIAEASNKIARRMAKLETSRAETEARTDEQERQLLLVAICYIASTTRIDSGKVFEDCVDDDFEARLAAGGNYTRGLAEEMAETEFNVPDWVIERLHILGNPLAARVVRCMGMPETLKAAFEGLTEYPGEQSFAASIAHVVKGWRRDLEELEAAGDQAVKECGILE